MNPQALREAFAPYSVRFGAETAAPLPGGSDSVLHSVALIKEYAGWIQARSLEMDACFNALDGVDLNAIGDAVQKADAAALTNAKLLSLLRVYPQLSTILPEWVSWRGTWAGHYKVLLEDIDTWTGWIGYVPFSQFFNPLTGSWDSLREQHSRMLAIRDEAAAAKIPRVPTIAPVPRPGVQWKDAVDGLGKVAGVVQGTLNLALIAIAVVGGVILLGELKK